MAFNLLGKAVKNLRLPTVDYLNAPTQVIPVQQGDTNSRFFEITLYDDRGTIPLSCCKFIVSVRFILTSFVHSLSTLHK